MAVSSYGSATDSSGVVRILKDLDTADRGPRRPDRRGHRRLGADAAVPHAQPRGPQPGLARGLRAAHEARRGARSTCPSASSASRSPTASRSATASTTPSATATCPTWPPSTKGEIAPCGPAGRERRAGTLDGSMSRFFKSAAFPILIVVVLAFFAQKLISPGESKPTPSYSQFLGQLERGDVKSADLKTKDNTVTVTLRDDSKYETGFADGATAQLYTALTTAERQGKLRGGFDIEGAKTNGWLSLLTYVLPFLIFIGFWIFLMNQVQGGGSKVMSFGKSPGQAAVGRLAEDHLPRRGGRRRGGGGAPRDQGVPREPQEVPGARRAHPQGRPALRAPGHRQDAAGPRGRGRGGRAVLLDLRLGLRRDVRRRRRLARARPLRAGQAELALHHLHGRDRRRRPPPRRRPGRRARRARADAQPAPGRDGRVRR